MIHARISTAVLAALCLAASACGGSKSGSSTATAGTTATASTTSTGTQTSSTSTGSTTSTESTTSSSTTASGSTTSTTSSGSSSNTSTSASSSSASNSSSSSSSSGSSSSTGSSSGSASSSSSSSGSSGSTGAGLPDAPGNVNAGTGIRSATVTWSTPNDNGSAITGYTLTSNPAGGTATAAPGDTSATVTGLANGTAYTFNVVATNAVGDSAPGVSNSITTYDVPSAPTALVATVGFGIATLTWNDPAGNGGQTVSGFALSWTDGTTTWSTTTYTDTFGNPRYRAMLEGLQDGVSFTFSVHAINAVGDGSDATVAASTPCGGVSLSGWPINDKSDAATGYLNIFARDLNGDGNPDVLALAGNSSGQRSTFLGQGNGTFERAQLVSGAGGGLAVTGDFNGDGVPDYVADVNLGGALGNIEFFAGYTDGGFGPGVAVGTLTSQAVAAAVGYIDGDSHLDVVFSPGRTYSVFLGQGDGTFPVRGDTVLPGSQGVRGLGLGDLDGDGHLDLVVATNSATSSPSGSAIFVQRGNGDGTFQPGTEFDTLGYFNDTSYTRVAKPVVITDFNKDNKLDVLTAGDAPGISLLLGLGDGGLAAPQNFATSCWHDALLVADVNHDGLPDLLAAGNGNCSPVNGNATYSPGFLDVALGTGTSTLGALRTYAVPAIGGIAAADFDHDGNLDLALAPESDITGIIPVHGLGDGGFELPAQYTSTARLTDLLVTRLGTSAPLAVISLEWDVNNSFTMQVASRQVNADGTLQAPVRTTLATNQQAGWPFFAAADINGDGNVDLVISENAFNGVSAFDVFTGDGAGHFTSASRTSFSSVVSAQLAAVDVNNDSKVDVVVNTGSQISIYPGNGNGTFGLAHAALVNQVNTNKLAVADLNHDGNWDLFVPPLVALGNGDFTFQTATSVAGVAGNSGWPLVADFNNDGYPDILAVGVQVEVGLNDGNGAFPTVKGTTVDYDAQLAPNRALAVADMDGDGNLDLVAAGDFGSVAILYGAGDGTFTNQVKYPAGAGVSGVAAADLNGDGRPDVAAIVYDNYVAQYLDVLLNQASACY
ncbi:MAG: VCBS repeat-containing protein [Deltaproteobacteria bacterium]|nr:VCBS repeat-containing protein [Deltaproteobacteria bacterium]